jgi:uncharacterized protein YegL
MPKQGKTEIAAIIDRSGSMSTIKNDVIGGFNQFLKSQQEQAGEATMTVVQFDNQYEITVDGKNISEVEELNENTFVPRGMTALLDAIGTTINSLGERFAKMNEEDRPEHVIVSIITDGDENSSREFTRDQINKMITHQQEKYNWKFIFLAANQDAIANARSIGISKDYALNFDANARGIQGVYNAIGTTVSNLRSVGHINGIYNGDDLTQGNTTGNV